MALPYKISEIIRCHEWQIHTHKIKWTWRFTRATTTAKNKLDATAENVEHTRDAWVLCNSLLMTTSLIDIVIENDALNYYLLHPLAETVTFLNSSRVSFLYSWRCKDIREKSGSLLKEQNIYPPLGFNSQRGNGQKIFTRHSYLKTEKEYAWICKLKNLPPNELL